MLFAFFVESLNEDTENLRKEITILFFRSKQKIGLCSVTEKGKKQDLTPIGVKKF